jgi:hypothetical protein
LDTMGKTKGKEKGLEDKVCHRCAQKEHIRQDRLKVGGKDGAHAKGEGKSVQQSWGKLYGKSKQGGTLGKEVHGMMNPHYPPYPEPSLQDT